MSEAYSVIKCENREEWLKQRLPGIGGSEAAAVLGVCPWKSPLSLYSEKIGLVDGNDRPSERMKWGLLLEDPIAARYQEETGRKVIDPGPFTIYRSNQFDFMQCSVDRVIEDASAASPLGILEIKNVAGFKLKDWLTDPPIHYQIQLQHSLIVTGRTWGSFAVLFGGQEFGYIDVTRNDNFCDYLIEKEQEFWNRVLNLDPPPADDSEDSKEILSKLYPRESGETIDLPAEAIEKDRRLQEINEQLKNLKRLKTGLENWFKERIGEALFGQCPNGIRYKWSTVERKGYTVQPKSFRQLRRIAS